MRWDRFYCSYNCRKMCPRGPHDCPPLEIEVCAAADEQPAFNLGADDIDLGFLAPFAAASARGSLSLARGRGSVGAFTTLRREGRKSKKDSSISTRLCELGDSSTTDEGIWTSPASTATPENLSIPEEEAVTEAVLKAWEAHEQDCGQAVNQKSDDLGRSSSISTMCSDEGPISDVEVTPTTHFKSCALMSKSKPVLYAFRNSPALQGEFASAGARPS